MHNYLIALTALLIGCLPVARTAESSSSRPEAALAELFMARRAQGDAMFSRGVAVSDEENAWTQRQAVVAAARYERANADVKASTRDVGKLTRRYNELVAKHGRE